jgi:hypothetical protein
VLLIVSVRPKKLWSEAPGKAWRSLRMVAVDMGDPE